MILSPEAVRASSHGKCCEISGEIMMLLFPQETKLDNAQILSRKRFHASFTWIERVQRAYGRIPKRAYGEIP